MPRRPIQRVLASVLVLSLAPCLCMAAPGRTGQSWQDLLRRVTGTTPAHSQDALPQGEVVSGLKQALSKGTTQAIGSLGRKDGFWGNPAVRIPLPGRLRGAARLARQLGQGARVDAFQLSLNRAAEKAVPEVASLFGDAIRRMTLKDALGILHGGDHAATDYFRRAEGPRLAERMRPIVAQATDSVGVTRRYKALVSDSQGGMLGTALSLAGQSREEKNLDLDTYVTNEALDGLFKTIGDEEKAIREHPAARTTDLLRKVFGRR